MSQDPLQYFALERWDEIQKIFKKVGYLGTTAIAVLDTQRALEERGFGYGFKVYCPFEDACNGMVAINLKEEFYEIIIQCPGDTVKLEEALKKTKIINWQKPIVMAFTPYRVINCLRKVLEDHIDIKVLPSETFILDKRPIFVDARLPSGTTFGLLSAEHVNLINSTWPHRYPNSSSYFKYLININYGYGLFQDDKLIAWIFISESGTLLHLYTIETERRKGVAELLLKLVSNILVEKNRPMIAYCLKDNVNACKLYSKLGFVKTEPVAWCYLNKK